MSQSNQTTRTQSVVNAQGEIVSISLDAARRMAPAAFAKSPAPHIKSKSYNFTSTEEVIGHMQDLGYILTGAKQTNTKSALWQGYGSHIVTFQHPQLYVKDSNGGVEARPTVVMSNSHDGSRPVQFDMGMFRLVCSNGLMIKSMDLGQYRERHSKMDLNGIKAVLDDKLTQLPNTINTINKWVSREMDSKTRVDFAKAALALRVGEERLADIKSYELQSVLDPKRDADRATNLWTTYNVVQENLIRGGYTLGERSARAITNPWADMKINQDLWALAEQYA